MENIPKSNETFLIQVKPLNENQRVEHEWQILKDSWFYQLCHKKWSKSSCKFLSLNQEKPHIYQISLSERRVIVDSR